MDTAGNTVSEIVLSCQPDRGKRTLSCGDGVLGFGLLVAVVLVLGPGRSHHGAGAHLTVRRRGVEAHDMRAGARSARYSLRIGDSFPGAIVRWSSAAGS
jgi:hypothetical protein